ncbi:MAG: extracellular solute-binding protein, partial [Rectinema sp.]
YNTDLIGDIEIKGYMDLLNPDLKGKIAAADPSASSSALFQVENMIAAFGGFESEKGWQDSWDYISKLITNIDGKVASGSSAVWKSVADGEMIVGLTYEEAAFNLVRDGAPVQIVYPEEGTFFSPTPVAIIKNGPNNENAKLFVDFLISKEGQEAIAAMGSSRPVRDDVQLHESIAPNSEIYSVTVDEAYMYTIVDTIKETYQDLFADLFPG